jgi:hypothetical protein
MLMFITTQMKNIDLIPIIFHTICIMQYLFPNYDEKWGKFTL